MHVLIMNSGTLEQAVEYVQYTYTDLCMAASKEQTKEYISVIEGTAPAIVLQRFDSPNLSPLCLQYTYCTTCPSDRAGGEWLGQGETNLCKTMAGAVPSTSLIFIL